MAKKGDRKKQIKKDKHSRWSEEKEHIRQRRNALEKIIQYFTSQKSSQ